MFKQMQRRLTIYYSLVIIVLLLVINTGVYFAVSAMNKEYLFRETHNMMQALTKMEWDDDDMPMLVPDRRFFFYYLYSADGKTLASYDQDASLRKELLRIVVDSRKNPFHVELNKAGQDIHLMVFKVRLSNDDNEQSKMDLYAGIDVSMSYLVLSRLLKALMEISAIGAMAAVIIGYLMAGRAIRPIRESYESKQHFLANASHELRTPISVLRLSLDVLTKEGTITDPFLQQVLHDMVEETNRAGRLVDELLTLARSDSNVGLVREEFDLNKSIDDVCRTLKVVAESREIVIEQDMVPGLTVYADQERISQVLRILLENAIKYSDSGSIIAINCGLEDHNGGFYIQIKDSGIGIPPEHLDKIFDRFYRVDSSRSHKTGGSGLGLSIAKMLVDAHGGRIEVMSQPGQGSIFTVHIPSGDDL